jgi:hypothetical protein
MTNGASSTKMRTTACPASEGNHDASHDLSTMSIGPWFMFTNATLLLS